MKWDYALVYVVNEQPRIADILWDKGDDGWELVTVLAEEDGVSLYFKKPAE